MKANHCKNCPLCNQSFSDNEIFAKHIKDDHAPSYTSCSKNFETKVELEKHIEDVHNNKKNTRECVECKKWFATEDILRNHTTESHPITITCSICCEAVKDQTEMDNHMKNWHNVLCPVC